MPVLVNPFRFGTTTLVDLTEPWGEVARVTSVVGGKLTISGLNLSGIQVMRLYINGVTVTTDDSQIFLRFLIADAEISTGYRWGVNRLTSGLNDLVASAAGTELPLSSSSTRGVGNASTEAIGAVVTIFDPGSATLYKRSWYHTVYSKPDGTLMELATSIGALENTGALTGVVLYGSSDLTAGSIVVLGVE